jgi:universal stress protein A
MRLHYLRYNPPVARYEKILLLVDLSEDSAQVAAAVTEIMHLASGAQIVVLHVVEFVPIDPMGESSLPTPPLQRALVEQAQQNIVDLARRCGLGHAKCRIESGNTKDEILRVADEEHADLIVLGSRERHGLAILVNFTEDTVLHAAHCDVLAVRLR